MSDAFWIAFFAAIPGIFIGITGIIALLMKVGHLHELVNGKFTEMLQLVATSSKIEGKVDVLVESTKKADTKIIENRRTDNVVSSSSNEARNASLKQIEQNTKDTKDVLDEIKQNNDKSKKDS